MNRASVPPAPAAQPATAPPRPHRIAFLGFSEFERSALATYFRLAAEREHRYELVFTLTDADFLVADADHAPSVQLVVVTERLAETVFIGSQAPEGAAGSMRRPIDALHVMRALDTLAHRGDPAPAVPPPAETPAPEAGVIVQSMLHMPAPVAAPVAVPASAPLVVPAAASAPASFAASVHGPVHEPVHEPAVQPAVLPAVSEPAPLISAAPAAQDSPAIWPPRPTPFVPTPQPAPVPAPAVAQTPAVPIRPAAPRTPPPQAPTRSALTAAYRSPMRPSVPTTAAPVFVGPPAPARALLVDDSLIALRFLATRLAPWGVRTDSVTTSEQALQQLGLQAYDFIFLDLELGPVSALDGLALCRHIKRSELAISATVVMVSAHHSEIDRARGALAGCDAYLSKPLQEAELAAVLRHQGLRPPQSLPLKAPATAGAWPT